MQRDKTIKFWDDFYSDSTLPGSGDPETTDAACCSNQEEPIASSPAIDKEWILHPSDALLEAICSYLPVTTGSNVREILEIGCGVSYLSKELWRYLQKNHHSDNMTDHSVTATDVSTVCIDQMGIRDHETIQSSNGTFSYEYLNVLSVRGESTAHERYHYRYSMILDKGCLDTFLFRSCHKIQWDIMHTLLDNIHCLLKDEGGVYLILSPRSKIKPIRDYAGFKDVKRVVLDEEETNVILGDLDGRRERNTQASVGVGDCETTVRPTDGSEKEVVYMWVCVKNETYIPGGMTAPFRELYDTSVRSDGESCPSCEIPFHKFIGSDVGMEQGEKTWRRRWKGHKVHCKKPKVCEELAS